MEPRRSPRKSLKARRYENDVEDGRYAGKPLLKITNQEKALSTILTKMTGNENPIEWDNLGACLKDMQNHARELNAPQGSREPTYLRTAVDRMILQDHLEIRAQDGTKLFLDSTGNKRRFDGEDSDVDSEAGPDPETSPIKLTGNGRKRLREFDDEYSNKGTGAESDRPPKAKRRKTSGLSRGEREAKRAAYLAKIVILKDIDACRELKKMAEQTEREKVRLRRELRSLQFRLVQPEESRIVSGGDGGAVASGSGGASGSNAMDTGNDASSATTNGLPTTPVGSGSNDTGDEGRNNSTTANRLREREHTPASEVTDMSDEHEQGQDELDGHRRNNGGSPVEGPDGRAAFPPSTTMTGTSATPERALPAAAQDRNDIFGAYPPATPRANPGGSSSRDSDVNSGFSADETLVAGLSGFNAGSSSSSRSGSGSPTVSASGGRKTLDKRRGKIPKRHWTPADKAKRRHPVTPTRPKWRKVSKSVGRSCRRNIGPVGGGDNDVEMTDGTGGGEGSGMALGASLTSAHGAPPPPPPSSRSASSVLPPANFPSANIPTNVGDASEETAASLRKQIEDLQAELHDLKTIHAECGPRQEESDAKVKNLEEKLGYLRECLDGIGAWFQRANEHL